MKRIHIVNPYGSVAMARMTLPLLDQLPLLYVVSESKAPDDSADLNYHIPYHTMVGYERQGNSKHVIVYTHCNPPDVPNLADACERADAVICMSFTGRAELVSYGIDPVKLHVIYSASDQFQFKRRNVGIIGFVQPNGRKREGILLDLAWQYDLSPFHLVIVGGGWGPTVNALKAMGVSVEWIEFANDDDMRKIYPALDALLVTGYVEGGPLPLLEAMASGLHVISPSFGYAADLLEAENLYSTVEELTERLDVMVKKPIENYRITRAWTWADYVAEHALIFGRLLGEGVDLYPARGMSRYAQLLDVIDECKPRSIVEIGTWKGDRAIQMIQQAAKYHPMDKIVYQGFDLFEQMDGEKFRAEYSKASWPLSVVRRRIEATGARIELVQGNTNEIEGPADIADLYFIDGGHSVETITNDWALVMSSMTNGTIVFDDYYHSGASPEFGCNVIIDKLDRSKWEVCHLPARTTSHDGKEIGMVKVRKVNNADIRLQMQEQSRNGSGTWHYAECHGDLPGVSWTDAPRPTDPDGELERPTAAP